VEEAGPPLRLVRSRRVARQTALQALYQIEIGGARREEALADALGRCAFHAEAAAFVRDIVSGVLDHRSALDAKVAPLMAEGWEYARIAVTDRTVLRIAAFELFHMPSMPPKVTINEAIDLAKLFGSPYSGRFVNGVLGRLLEGSPKAAWTAPASDELEAGADGADRLDTSGAIAESGPGELEASPKAGAWTLRAPEEGDER
jgi:N utilization substance protein B